ncbi:MAG: hypothetical protein O2987_03315 [Firmicutes bacterium]|nr:hypothetical protein [Bacillota bacterium]
MKSVQDIKRSLSSVDRFKSFKQAGKLLLIGFIIILIGGFLFNGDLLDYQPIVILSGFGLFFLGFVFIFIGFFNVSKKQQAFLNIIYNDIWKPYIQEVTFSTSANYFLQTENTNTERTITHPVIPSYAGETFHFSLKKDQYMSLDAVVYSHSTSSGERTSTYIDFIGFVIQTEIEVNSNLLVRKHAPIANFFKSGLKSFSVDQEIDGYDITGNFTPELKELKTNILNLGFKEIMFIPEKGKLMILIPEFKIHGNLKMRDSLLEDAKIHVTRLIQLLEML